MLHAIYVEDLSFREYADRIGVPKSTIHSRLGAVLPELLAAINREE